MKTSTPYFNEHYEKLEAGFQFSSSRIFFPINIMARFESIVVLFFCLVANMVIFSHMRCQTLLSTQLQDPVPPTGTADPVSQAPLALLPTQIIPSLLSIAPASPGLAPRAIPPRYIESRSDLETKQFCISFTGMCVGHLQISSSNKFLQHL